MRKNSSVLLLALSLFAACGAGGESRKIRVELPSYSPLHLEQFEEAVFSGFIVGKETAPGLDLNKEIWDYFGAEFERKLHFRVSSAPVLLENEDLFVKPDFWRSLAPGSGRVLFVTGTAELARETRKTILEAAKAERDDRYTRQKEVAERAVFSLSLHLFLIRGDNGEIILDRDFKETKAYSSTKQRADFAFFELAQRIRAKLFRPLLSEEKLQERYLLFK
jgi:hypothetical protein